MVQTYSDIVQMRGGSTPFTFDGNQPLNLNEKARKLVGIKVSHSVSTMTTEEAVGMLIRLQSSNWNGSRYFHMGFVAHAPPATNESTASCPGDFIALDIDVAPNSSITVDVTTALGATMTGTNDITIEIIYSDGPLPADVIAAMSGLAGMPPVKGGVYGYTTALTGTTETALTGNATTLNLPAEAREVVGVSVQGALDTAVTAAEELSGYCRIDYGLADQGTQRYAYNFGFSPGLGTEVDGGVPQKAARNPIYIGNLPARELQVRGYLNAYGTVTGGADYLVVLYWR